MRDADRPFSTTFIGPPPWRTLIHVPHAGRMIPPRVRESLLVDDEHLDRELALMTDWHTDRLALDAADASGTSVAVFVNHLSRLVVDPERLPDDEEPMAAIGMGSVYRVTSQLEPLRAPDPVEATELRASYLDPYSAALSDLTEQLVDAAGEVTIIDLHSYPAEPLPYEPDPAAVRPEVCIGTDPFHTPVPVRVAVETAFDGIDLSEDTPFAGTYVPLRHLGADARVRSVMIEIRRDTYMVEPAGSLRPTSPIPGALVRLLQQLADPTRT